LGDKGEGDCTQNPLPEEACILMIRK
jgi:hypothetical protein